MTRPEADPQHLEPHQVVAYIERSLPVVDRRRVEAHLSACELCTAEIAAVIRLRRRPARRVPWIPIGVAAAAAVAGLLVARPLVVHRSVPGADVERQGQPTARLQIVAPAAGARVSEPVVFAWRAAAGASVYRVTLTREDGDSVWAGTTSDTTLAVPPGVSLAGTARYYWYVDALLANGASLSTGIHEFMTGP